MNQFKFWVSALLSLLLWENSVSAAEIRRSQQAPALVFSTQETAYITNKPVIKMCVDPDWEPFERINEQGLHVGISADLVQLVAERVGLKIELYPVRSWDESLAASKAGQCQIMSFLNQTPARDQWLVFTDPIFIDQNIIVTHEDHPYIGDLKWLKDKTVALPRGTMVEERIRKDYPDLKIITTSSEPEAISLVSKRQADMTVRSLMVAAFAIKKEGLFNLKISGQVPDYTNKLRIGVIKDEPILRDILDKGVKSISVQEREAIANRHISINVQRGTDYTLVWEIAILAALLLTIALVWNKKLSRMNRELARMSVTDKLTGLFNRQKLDTELEREFLRAVRFNQPFSVILLDVDFFKQVNDRYGHQVGDQVLQNIANLLQKQTRATDVLGRWGGEEFMVICAQTDVSGAAKLAELLRQLIDGHDFPNVHHKTASFGVTAYQAGDHVNTIVSRADEALYEAKRAGRNRVSVK